MKNFKLQSLFLLSRTERRARIEWFDKCNTVVMGANDTGKSCLLKSIYAAFGADAAKINPRWKATKSTIRLDFSIDDQLYTIVRQGGLFGLFDDQEKLLWVHTGVVSEVGPKIAKLLDFGIQLSNKQQQIIVPPPSYCFLPFYIDQDAGWQSPWSSFAGLMMIPNYKKDISEFHTGLRPNEYYAAKIERDDALRDRDELSAERRALERANERLQSGRSPIGLEFDPKAFVRQIDQLLKEVGELQQTYDSIKKRVGELQSRRAVAIEEQEIAKSALSELEADFRFVSEIQEDHILCPTCGTEHENDFANKFGLLADADMCRAIISDSRENILGLNEQISAQLNLLKQYSGKIDKINAILDETRGDVKLRDMLEDESERILEVTIGEEFRLIDSQIGTALGKANDAETRMKSFDAKSRRKDIEKFYGDRLRKFARELNVAGLAPSTFQHVHASVKETGSDLPRALLAYYYAIFHTIREFSTACVCPIVLDTPLQQDQDPSNAFKMIEFALNNVPSGMQLILGTVGLHDVPFTGHVIQTSEKESLLNEECYSRACAAIDPLLDQMHQIDQDDLFRN